MSEKGFTLVELLAVIALLGILVLLIGPRVLDKYHDAQKGILLDEAKNIYNEATNKYLQERTKGNRITQIYSSLDGSEGKNELDLVGEDVNYTIRLDNDGNVTALKVDNKRYCVEGIGKFLENATIDDVISLQDNPSACQRVDLMENERVKIRLLAKNPDLRDVNPKLIYLRYKKEWLNEEGKKITTITETPKMSNYMFDGFYYTDDEGAKTRIIDETGKIVGPTDVIRKSTDEGVTASAEYYKKYYTVTYNGNNATSGSMIPTKHEYLETTALAQNAFSRIGYTYQNWNTVANGSGETYTDKQSMPVVSEKTENDGVFKQGYNLNLYAIWKANQYTITFDPNGGTVSQTTKTVTYDQAYGTLPTPTKTGYSFDGWYVDGNEIKDTSIVKISSNTSASAKWTANQYKVVYNSNDGKNKTQSVNVKYDESFTIINYTETRENYTFLGWTFDSTSTVATYSANQSVKNLSVVNNSIVNLYAVWKLNYSIAFNYTGKFTVTKPNVTSNAVTFANQLTGDFQTLGKEWTIWFLTSGTLTIKGISENVDMFLVGGGVSGGSNGHSGNVDESKKPCYGGVSHGQCNGACGGSGGERITVTNKMLSEGTYEIKIGAANYNSTAFGYTARTGYGSAGGYRGVGYKSSCSNPGNGTDGEYAFGNANIDGIKYGAGGGGGATWTDSDGFSSGSWPTCWGQRLGGGTGGGKGGTGSENGKTAIANTGSGGGGVGRTCYSPYSSSAGDNGAGGSGILLLKNAESYEIAYSLDLGTKGSSMPSSSTFNNIIEVSNPTKSIKITFNEKTTSGASFNYNGATVKNNGSASYTFAGWRINNYNSTTAKMGSTASTVNASVTNNLTTNKFYNNLQNKAGEVVSFSAYWTSPQIKLPKITKTGHDCYWNGDYGTFASEGIFTPQEIGAPTETSFNASCTPHVYQITFEPNGGNVNQINKDVTYLSTFGELPVPTRTGYTFKGWFTAKSGGTQIKETTQVKITKNTTYYAQWTANKYNVTFDANSGKIGSNLTQVKQETYAAKYVLPSNPTKTGYTFLGWFTEINAGEKITNTNIVNRANDHTLYAHWESKKYDLTFNVNGGIAWSEESCNQIYNNKNCKKTITYDEKYNELPIPSRDNYNFVGWFTASGGGNEVTSETLVSVTNNQTLYAHWTKK